MLLIYSAFVALATISAFKANDLSLLNSENSIFIRNEQFEPNLSMHKINKSEQGIQEYKINLSREDLSALNSDVLILFLNKLTDNAYSVKLNGIIIGSEGDMKKGHSMFKSSPNHFSFDSKLIEDNNLLIINTYATYKSGLESKGIYITDSHIGMRQSSKVDFYGRHLIMVGIGFLIFSALVMVFIYFINRERELGFLYCAIATVFITIFFVDFLKIVYLNYSYLFYKKIFLTSLYVAVWFYTLSMSKFLKCFYLKYISGFTAITFIIMSLLVDDFILYKKLYSYWYLGLILTMIIGFIYSLKDFKKVRQAFIFVAAFFYSTVYASMSILIEFFHSSSSINSPLVYMVIFSALPLLFGFEELTSKQKQIHHEKEQTKNEYINSITDNLTGTWNQRFLYKKLEESKEDIILAMIDIDDFKLINDNYGHLAGDFILKEFTNLAIETIRKTDHVCRYGGDEFIILLYNCNEAQAALVMENLREKVEKHNFVFGNQSMKITISVGIYNSLEGETVDQALKKTDKQLYISKEKGKNSVSLYKL